MLASPPPGSWQLLVSVAGTWSFLLLSGAGGMKCSSLLTLQLKASPAAGEIVINQKKELLLQASYGNLFQNVQGKLRNLFPWRP